MHYLFALIQEATAGSTGYVPYIASTIVLIALAWVLKTTRDVARTLERIELYLFGIDGENGLRSKVTEIEKDVGFLLERRVGVADRRQAQ